MKSKDFQSHVLSQYQNVDEPTKIFRGLNGSISLQAIERWCKALRDIGSIKFTWSSENHSNKGKHSKGQTSTRATESLSNHEKQLVSWVFSRTQCSKNTQK